MIDVQDTARRLEDTAKLISGLVAYSQELGEREKLIETKKEKAREKEADIVKQREQVTLQGEVQKKLTSSLISKEKTLDFKLTKLEEREVRMQKEELELDKRRKEVEELETKASELDKREGILKSLTESLEKREAMVKKEKLVAREKQKLLEHREKNIETLRAELQRRLDA